MGDLAEKRNNLDVRTQAVGNFHAIFYLWSDGRVRTKKQTDLYNQNVV